MLVLQPNHLGGLFLNLGEKLGSGHGFLGFGQR